MWIGYGVGIFLPLLAFNATIEAPIMGRFLGVRFSELWWPWFKANVWSLLSGIPVLIVNTALKEWWVPTELGARVRVYPIFLMVSILIYLLATVLVEFLYARKLVREAERQVANPRLRFHVWPVEGRADVRRRELQHAGLVIQGRHPLLEDGQGILGNIGRTLRGVQAALKSAG